MVAEKEGEKFMRDVILKKLDRSIDESSSNLSREDNVARDYKKMYWDLIDNLRKIVGNVDTTSKIISK